MATLNVTRYGFGRPQSLNRRLPSFTRSYQSGLSRPSAAQVARRPSGAGFTSGTLAAPPYFARVAPPQPTAQDTISHAKAQTEKVGEQERAETAQYEADPILQQIRAMGRASVATARAGAEGQRRQQLIEFGDEQFARGVLPGASAEDPIFRAIRENALSTTAQLRKESERERGEAEERFNRENLFYGGARIKGLEELGQTQLSRSASAQSSVRDRLSAIEQALMQAEQDALDREIDYLLGRRWKEEEDDVPPEESPPAPPPAGGQEQPQIIDPYLLNELADRLVWRRPHFAF